MPELDKPKEEEFCRLVALRETKAEAARAAKISRATTDDSVRAAASRLGMKPHIIARIAELIQEERVKQRALAAKYEVNRELCLQNAMMAFDIAWRQENPHAMNNNNLTMARIAGLLKDEMTESVLRLIDKATEAPRPKP